MSARLLSTLHTQTLRCNRRRAGGLCGPVLRVAPRRAASPSLVIAAASASASSSSARPLSQPRFIQHKQEVRPSFVVGGEQDWEVIGSFAAPLRERTV